jgi:hypothetical protein
MKKIFYEKVGRKYVPVSEYDDYLLDSFPEGSHIVMCYPGGSSRRYRIDPALAPMIAAGRYAEDAICKAINKASELKPANTPITAKQKAAWEALAEAFGEELATLHGPSIRDIAEAGVQAMQEEAEKMLANPAVRKAYENFQLMCQLVKENDGRK